MIKKPLKTIPYNTQLVGEDDIKAVGDALRSDYLTTGPITTEFEEELASYLGVSHAVVCANGTAALHLSILALDIGPGDAVITTPVTFLSDANAARFEGADVVFVDINPITMNLEPAAVRAELQKRDNVKAIIVVHFGGNAAPMEEFAQLAAEFGVTIIEDGCHALGGHYLSDGCLAKIGCCIHSALTTFSFHPIKNITTGEGGAITTNDEVLANRLRKIRRHGTTNIADEFVEQEQAFTILGSEQVANPWYYEMQELAYNYRLTDFQAALGISQLKKLDYFITARNYLAHLYDTELAQLNKEELQGLKTPDGTLNARHLYVITYPMHKLQGGRNALMQELLRCGIQTQVHYIPIHMQPYYKSYLGEKPNVPVAEACYKNCLSLPIHLKMGLEEVKYIVKSLGTALDELSLRQE